MVNMDESSGHTAIGRSKVEPAHEALNAVVLNALLSGLDVPLMFIEFHLLNRSLKQRLAARPVGDRLRPLMEQLSLRLSGDRNDAAHFLNPHRRLAVAMAP